MARRFTVTTDYGDGVFSGLVGTSPVATLAYWGRRVDTVNNGPQFCTGIVGSTNTTYQITVNSAGACIASRRTGGGILASATTGNIWTGIGSWHHLCGVFASTTSRSVYFDGGNKTSNSTSGTTGAMTHCYLNTQGNLAGGGTGAIANLAIWNVALGDGEVLMLARGISPLLVRREALVFYVPRLGLSETEYDVINGTIMVPTGTWGFGPRESNEPPNFYVDRLPHNPRFFLMGPVSADALILPSVGLVTTAGLAPRSLGNIPKPGVGLVTMAGLAPTELRNRTVLPAVGLVTTAGLAPLVLRFRTVLPSVGLARTGGLAPLEVRARTVLPSVGLATTAGLAPTEIRWRTVLPSVGLATMGGLAPSTATRTVLPGVGLVTTAGLAPLVLRFRTVLPSVGLARTAGLAPVETKARTVLPSVGLARTGGLAPTELRNRTVLPSVGLARTAGLAPAQIGDTRTVLPTVGFAQFLGLVPTIVLAGAQPSTTIAPAVGLARIAGLAPTLSSSFMYGRRRRTKRVYVETELPPPLTPPLVPERSYDPLPAARVALARLEVIQAERAAQAAREVAKAKRRKQNRDAINALLSDE